MTYGGRCTGCGTWIPADPYFRRRIKRHLADWENHNHDAVAIIRHDADEYIQARKEDKQ